MKRILKIISIFLLVVVILLIATPFLFKGKLEDLLKKTINNNVNAQVTWQALDISLLKGFPDAIVTLSDFSVSNNAPFQGDTLASGKELQIAMGIRQLFKSGNDTPIQVDALRLDDAVINIQIDTLGNASYDIGKSKDVPSQNDTTVSNEDTATPFSFALNHYEINNATINYLDASSNTYLRLSEVYHEGNGDLSANQSTLQTNTRALASFDLDGTHYLDNNTLQLDADIQVDLENQKYSFLENKAIINALPLQFDGYVQLQDDATAMDLSFETPTSDFKNFLAIIPKAYAKSLDGVQTGGDFSVSGKIHGSVTEHTIPKMDIAIVSNNASFKYPDLPKQMNNINIDAKIKNQTGNANDTYVHIDALNFKIDDDLFSTTGKLRNLTTNILVNLAIKGTLNLANLEKVYPLDLKTPLEGKLIADMSTAFDMKSIEAQQYQNIKSTGQAQLNDLKYAGEELPKPITIRDAAVTFNPGIITLNNFEGKSGDTDIKAHGTIENLIPFVMSKEDLKGRFDVTSKMFNLNDFSVPETPDTSTTTRNASEATTTNNTPGDASIQIPDFLDASLNFKADRVIYDDLELTAVSGTVAIEDEKATLHKVNSSIFGGQAGLSGHVSTKTRTPVFDMLLDLSKIDITQSFQNVDLLKGLAPIAKALQGSITTKIDLKGELDESFAPILTTLDGGAFAQILTANIHTEESPLLTQLDNQLQFIDLTTIDLSKLKTNLEFKDGSIAVTPFAIKIDDITANISGGHSFDNVMNYQVTLDLPGKYLGDQVGGLLSKLSDTEQESLSVDVPISLSGNFTKPTVKLDTKTAVSDLTNQIIAIQKKRLLNEGTEGLNDIIGGIIGGNKDTAKDSTSTNTQTPKADEIIKDVGDVLGGLFGRKKKKKETKKDSTGNR